MKVENVWASLLVAVVLAIVLPVAFLTVWWAIHADAAVLNIIMGALMVGVPVAVILGATVIGLLAYLARDRRADMQERLAQMSEGRQERVIYLPQPVATAQGVSGPYRYRVVTDDVRGADVDEIAPPGVVLGEAERF